MRRSFRFMSSRIMFVGCGGRANGVIDRLSVNSISPSFSFASITDDARNVTGSHLLVNEQLQEADHAIEMTKLLSDQVFFFFFFFFLIIHSISDEFHQLCLFQI